MNESQGLFAWRKDFHEPIQSEMQVDKSVASIEEAADCLAMCELVETFQIISRRPVEIEVWWRNGKQQTFFSTAECINAVKDVCLAPATKKPRTRGSGTA